jgi:hypothetical protein
MTEEWKIAIEDYEISNLGNCRKKQKSGLYVIIKGSIQNGGYRYFQLNRNGKRNNYMFHCLVAKCFIGERPEKYDIDHIDRNKLNNNLNNLRYVTHKENSFNHALVKDEIPQDTPNRRKIIQKMWKENNKETILQKKKEYYKENKEKWDVQNEKRRNDIIELKCSECHKNFSIQRKSHANKKTEMCHTCSSLLQLKKIIERKKKA